MPKRIAFSGTDPEIEELATKLRRAMDQKTPDELESVGDMLRWAVGELGGRVISAESPEYWEAEGGSLVIRGTEDFDIRLSPYTYYLRDNFTMAHELGHYFLHCDHSDTNKERPLVFTRYGSGRDEAQANRFAAALLMPAEEFRQKRKEFNHNITMLAAHFQVSRPAVKVRSSYL